MRKRTVPIVLLLLLTTGNGCQIFQESGPKEKLLASQKTFSSVVRSLTALRLEGKFDEGEVEKISFAIHSANAALDAWTQAVLEEREDLPALEMFSEALGELVRFRDDAREGD